MKGKKIFTSVIFLLACAFPALCADVPSLEREAMSIRVEYNRLGSSGDPFEREALLQKIIDTCKGTEEAEIAYWDLADLYLDGFPTEMRQEAREMLELCLREYPKTQRALLVKCRLIDLYDAKDSRRVQLVKELQNNKSLPYLIRSSIN